MILRNPTVMVVNYFGDTLHAGGERPEFGELDIVLRLPPQVKLLDLPRVMIALPSRLALPCFDHDDDPHEQDRGRTQLADRGQ